MEKNQGLNTHMSAPFEYNDLPKFLARTFRCVRCLVRKSWAKDAIMSFDHCDALQLVAHKTERFEAKIQIKLMMADPDRT